MTLAQYRTLETDKRFKNPPKDDSSYPLLKDAVAPHVGSFNALMDGPEGGLLNLAVKDIGSKTIFDTPETSTRLGNKLKIRVDSVQLAKPSVPANDKLSLNRKLFQVNVEKEWSLIDQD